MSAASLPRDPTQDEAFDRLVEQWRGDHLGPDKGEGVGLLWKEGGIVELFVALHAGAAMTMAALADRLVALDPEVSHPKFGAGHVVADLGDRARVRFDDGSERMLLWRFLTGK